MGSNVFGTIFKIMTFGESHGKALGVVIDGCPAGLELSVEEIQRELYFRRPALTSFTSPRSEKDEAEILSGVFEGQTTGAPICILIPNRDSDTSKYVPIKNLLRPGHANFTYLEKYGVFDYRGGGRSSARETVCRVAAGAVAKKLLAHFKIEAVAYLKEVGDVKATCPEMSVLKELTRKSPLFCPDKQAETQMMAVINAVKAQGDSLGGVVEFVCNTVPAGLGDPVYEKLEANLAKAMLSIPASKGIEFGAGFKAACMRGSEHNDIFDLEKGEVVTQTNHAGGILGGISTGMPLVFRVAFKPTSSILKPQETLTTTQEKALFELPEGSRHDPCVAIRAVPVVEAMAALVLADALLMNRLSRI